MAIKWGFLDDPAPRHVSDLTQIKRMACYQKGGVYFVSSNVIILDLLKKQIGRPITGLVITHAERALRKKEENFIINLARFNGSDTFIHCLTDAPSAVSKNIDKIMSTLMINHLELFPRFHEKIKTDHSKHLPKVENIEVCLTDKMIELQRILLDLMTPFFGVSKLLKFLGTIGMKKIRS